MKSLVLFEPNFRSFSGHYNRYARVVGTEAARHGVSVQVAASKEVDGEVCASLRKDGIEVWPVFPRVEYRLSRNRAQQCQTAQLVCDAALRHFASHRCDTAAWLSGLPSHAEAVSAFARAVRQPVLFQLVDFAEDWAEGAGTAPLIIRRSLTRGVDAGLKLFAQTQYMADVAGRECNVGFRPFPPILDFSKSVRPCQGRDRPRVGLMNVLIHYKEIDVLTKVLSVLAPRLSIVFHTGGTGAGRHEDYKRVYSEMGADVIEGVMPPSEYNRVWSSLDGVVLPYRPDKYRRQCSGMMFECLSDGIVPIVPDHTSMAALARETGVGLVFDAADPRTVEGVVLRFVEEWRSLKERAVDYASTWRKLNGPYRVFEILEEARVSPAPDNTLAAGSA